MNGASYWVLGGATEHAPPMVVCEVSKVTGDTNCVLDCATEAGPVGPGLKPKDVLGFLVWKWLDQRSSIEASIAGWSHGSPMFPAGWSRLYGAL